MTSADFLWQTFFRPMVPSLFLKILEFIVHKISRGNSRILFLSQRPDLLSWFYVYLFGLRFVQQPYPPFSLISGFCSYARKNRYTTSSILDITINDLWFTTLGGNYLWSVYLRLNPCHARHTIKTHSQVMIT